MSRVRIPFDATVLVMPDVEDDVTCVTCGREWVCVRPIGYDYRQAVCPNCKERTAELSKEAPRVVRQLH